MSTPRQSTRNSETSTQDKKLISCFYINEYYPQIGCEQCSACDGVREMWGPLSDIKKILTKDRQLTEKQIN